MYRSIHHRAQPPRRGFVLIAVMIVVVLLSLASYQFAALMTSEYRVADSASRSAQANALAAGGIDYFIANVTNPTILGQQTQAQITSNIGTTDSTQSQTAWQAPNVLNNTSLFQGIAVGTSDGTTPQGRFSIVAPIGYDEIANNSMPFHFGATDEGGKINLNAMMKLDPSGTTLGNMLMALQPALPNLTQETVNSILDWMDTDDTPREGGAEDEYYQGLSPPYHCKNGPIDSLEELLLVQGVTPSLLLGNDRNRNGVLDPGEDDGTGQVSFGLSAFVTMYSRELNISSNGQPRIYINAADLNQLQTDLSQALGQDLANYIVAYRKYGPASTGGGGGGGGGSGGGGRSGGGSSGGGGSGGGSSGGGGNASFVISLGGSSGGTMTATVTASTGGGGSGTQIKSLFELVGSSVSVPGSNGGKATTMQSPLNDQSTQQQLLPVLLDECTTVNSPEIPARINVNTAPQEVINALPGIQQTDAANIIANQPSPTTDPPDPTYSTTAWLVTVAGISPKTMQSLEKYITASSQVYRIQSIGYFDQGGPSARIEAVVDTNGGMPRILFWRDLTDLGPGFDLQAISGQQTN
jgi:type II secretory pathway component PulK